VGRFKKSFFQGKQHVKIGKGWEVLQGDALWSADRGQLQPDIQYQRILYQGPGTAFQSGLGSGPNMSTLVSSDQTTLGFIYSF